MNDALEQFIKLPKSQKLFAIAFLYVLVIGLFVYLVWMPGSEELESIQARQVSMTEELKRLNETASDLDRFRLEVEALNEDLNKALKELPNERELDKLLKRVSTIGKKIGLEFLLFQPLPEVTQEFYAEVPVKIEVAGSFHEVAMFFDRIGKLSRIVNINEIQMSGPQERGGKIILKTAGKATTYRFIDAGGSKPAAPAEGEAKPEGGE